MAVGGDRGHRSTRSRGTDTTEYSRADPPPERARTLCCPQCTAGAGQPSSCVACFGPGRPARRGRNVRRNAGGPPSRGVRQTGPVMELRRARVATFAFFVLNGFLVGMWVVHIPAIQGRTGVGTTELGWLLLLLGLGALGGMQVGGRLVDRYGSSVVVLYAGALLSLTVVGPAFATSPLTLGPALVVFGLANGLLDVSMNTHAVEVERHYERPIMGAFHAYYSVGGLVAALIGGPLIAAGVPLAATLGGAAALGLVSTAACRTAVLAPEQPRTPSPPDAPRTRSQSWSRRVLGLGLLAFALMLAEGVANDWSTVHLHESLGTSEASAAWAYGLFSAAMTVGRLLTDRIVARIGSVAFVRAGALVAAVGLAVAAVAPGMVVALVGWTVFGLGLSGCVPQFFSAAGNLDRDASGTNLARVAGLGYLGLLAGPAVIGLLTHWVDLPTAFWLPVAGCVLSGALAARLLRGRTAVGRPSGDG
ncbi:MAG: MFS transporter [Nocardioidaceae bacterium]